MNEAATKIGFIKVTVYDLLHNMFYFLAGFQFLIDFYMWFLQEKYNFFHNNYTLLQSAEYVRGEENKFMRQTLIFIYLITVTWTIFTRKIYFIVNKRIQNVTILTSVNIKNRYSKI